MYAEVENEMTNEILFNGREMFFAFLAFLAFVPLFDVIAIVECVMSNWAQVFGSEEFNKRFLCSKSNQHLTRSEQKSEAVKLPQNSV